jgi:small-conductance mechanosensitive channel
LLSIQPDALRECDDRHAIWGREVGNDKPSMIDTAALRDALMSMLKAIGAEITSLSFYLQLGLMVVAAGMALAVAVSLRSRTNAAALAKWPRPLRRVVIVLIESSGVLVFALLTLVMREIMLAYAVPGRGYLLSTAASLAFAWLIIRLATSMIRNRFAVRLLSVSAWTIAALSIVGLLDPIIGALDSVAVVLGGIRLTPLLIIETAVSLVIALWIASVISTFLESWINSSPDLTPSLQVLLTKMMRVLLIVLAVAIVMEAVGINLSSLAIFSGAVGVGIGFGLQKIVANFISGIILLADKSVKPGDLVTVGDSFGRISAMNTRYISVAAGDGREFLIPNEDLVTQKVINWTYADRNTLVKVTFGTDYEADPRAVCKLAVAIATATPRVLALTPPTCLLTELGENGMRFSLTFWIADPEGGMDNVRSEVMLALWEAFRRDGIHVPYPVRDIRVRDRLGVDLATTPRPHPNVNSEA